MGHFVNRSILLQTEGTLAEIVIVSFLACAIAAVLFDICYAIWK
jgi:hypothetical protein